MGLMMKTDIAEATKKVSLSLFMMVVTLYDVHCIKVAVYSYMYVTVCHVYMQTNFHRDLGSIIKKANFLFPQTTMS